MDSTEKQNVPIGGYLVDTEAKLLLKLISKNNIILEDKNARGAPCLGLANYLHVTQQASISARCMRPTCRQRDTVTVKRREPLGRRYSVLSEFALHLLPALGPSIQVDAHLIGKSLIDCSCLCLRGAH